jgi:uncharacterized protein (DUF362 family)
MRYNGPGETGSQSGMTCVGSGESKEESAMTASDPHPIYSRDSTVYLISGVDKLETFHRTLDAAAFVPHLLNHWGQSGKAKEDFAVAIKPNLMIASRYEEDSPVYTDPVLVEDLIRIMRDEGFRRFAVVETENVYNFSYTGRRVGAVAELAGFRGQGYDVVDLAEDAVDLDYGGALGQHRAGRGWLEADYRISFGKNKTNWQCYYTACIKNVFGCLPEWDKMRHYHSGEIEFYQATVLIADKIPVHFGLLDAWTSGDGLSGHVRDAYPNLTRTFFASDNIYALDWVAGEKMGLDPLDCFVLKEAHDRWGPIDITRIGDLSPWQPWSNVRPWTVTFANWVEESYGLTKILSRSMANQMDERFPPVKKWQWLFGIAQAASRLFERITTKTS